MISVKVIPNKYELKMWGHAEYEEKGKDIVCAAASMLFYTLCETVTSYPDKAFKREPLIDVKEPRCICTPKDEYKANFDIIYQTILNGFTLLMEHYPENIIVGIVKD